MDGSGKDSTGKNLQAAALPLLEAEHGLVTGTMGRDRTGCGSPERATHSSCGGAGSLQAGLPRGLWQ